ncbi:unnamed protein product, partial [Phaeothamnion confervicola]
LLVAAAAGRATMVKRLLAFSADPLATNSAGDNAFCIAVRRGHADVCDLVLFGARADAPDPETGLAPLHLACAGDHLEILRLLASRPEVNLRARTGEGDGRRTALHIAAAAGAEQCIGFLLEFEMSADAADGRGRTPLVAALLGGHEAA